MSVNFNRLELDHFILSRLELGGYREKFGVFVKLELIWTHYQDPTRRPSIRPPTLKFPKIQGFQGGFLGFQIAIFKVF